MSDPVQLLKKIKLEKHFSAVFARVGSTGPASSCPLCPGNPARGPISSKKSTLSFFFFFFWKKKKGN